jgi:hypothetical protein
LAPDEVFCLSLVGAISWSIRRIRSSAISTGALTPSVGPRLEDRDHAGEKPEPPDAHRVRGQHLQRTKRRSERHRIEACKSLPQCRVVGSGLTRDHVGPDGRAAHPDMMTITFGSPTVARRGLESECRKPAIAGNPGQLLRYLPLVVLLRPADEPLRREIGP